MHFDSAPHSTWRRNSQRWKQPHIADAQKDDQYDMKGHTEKAQKLLVEVNNELKAATEAANTGMRK